MTYGWIIGLGFLVIGNTEIQAGGDGLSHVSPFSLTSQGIMQQAKVGVRECMMPSTDAGRVRFSAILAGTALAFDARRKKSCAIKFKKPLGTALAIVGSTALACEVYPFLSRLLWSYRLGFITTELILEACDNSYSLERIKRINTYYASFNTYYASYWRDMPYPSDDMVLNEKLFPIYCGMYAAQMHAKSSPICADQIEDAIRHATDLQFNFDINTESGRTIFIAQYGPTLGRLPDLKRCLKHMRDIWGGHLTEENLFYSGFGCAYGQLLACLTGQRVNKKEITSHCGDAATYANSYFITYVRWKTVTDQYQHWYRQALLGIEGRALNTAVQLAISASEVSEAVIIGQAYGTLFAFTAPIMKMGDRMFNAIFNID